jgi:hypothetical protein
MFIFVSSERGGVPPKIVVASSLRMKGQ